MHFLLEGKMHKIPPFLRLMGSEDTYRCMFLCLHRVGLGGARHKLRPFQIDGMWGHNLRPSHHQCLAERIVLHAVCSGTLIFFKNARDVQKRKPRVLGANFKVIKCGEHGSCPDGEASTTC